MKNIFDFHSISFKEIEIFKTFFIIHNFHKIESLDIIYTLKNEVGLLEML